MERQFSAHHMLLQAAQRSLTAAENQSDGNLYDELATLVFSAFCIEAFCNAVGERIFKSKWKGEREQKIPTDKLKLLTRELHIPYDVRAEPWAAAIWLFKLRNDIVHAKPEFVKPDEEQLTQNQFDVRQHKKCFPNSTLENRINLSNARKAFKVAEDIINVFRAAIPRKIAQGLFVDIASGSFSLSE